MEKTQKAILLASAIVLSSLSSYTFASTGDTTLTGSTTTSVTIGTKSFEFSTGVSILETTGTSVKVGWESLNGSNGYVLHYGEKSASESGKYENDTDLIEADKKDFTIDKLKSNTTYYLAISAFDKDANESPLSKEVSFTTEDSQEQEVSMNSAKVANLSIKSVAVLGENKLEITFSSDIDSKEGAKREFKLSAKDSKEIKITGADLTDSNKLVLTLETAMEAKKEYSLTVLSLQDKNGNNIEAGVDGQTSFTTPETFENLNSSSETGAINPVKEAKQLPKTGPESF